MNILQKLDLNDSEILVYEELLKDGEQKASQISKKTPLKRGLVYKTLEDLERKGLIIRENTEDVVSTFTPIHPNVLKGLVENKVKQAQDAQDSLDSELGSLISMYNLANNKPGVEFYEGIEGVKKVINDTLTSKTEIYTYADMEQVNKYMKKINEEYATKRDKLDLNKKVLLVDSDYTHKILENYKKTNLDIKFVKGVTHFATIMQIYDNKVSYTTLSGDEMIGIIIQDKNIFEMHKALFKNMWEQEKN